MAIIKETIQRGIILVGESAGIEFGFQETSTGTVGSMSNRQATVASVPIPQEIVELNSVSTGGAMWAKFRDARLDTGAPGIDIAGISSISVTLFDDKDCNPTQATAVLAVDAGIKYVGTSTTVRDLLIANAGSTVRYELTYTV